MGRASGLTLRTCVLALVPLLPCMLCWAHRHWRAEAWASLCYRGTACLPPVLEAALPTGSPAPLPRLSALSACALSSGLRCLSSCSPSCLSCTSPHTFIPDGGRGTYFPLLLGNSGCAAEWSGWLCAQVCRPPASAPQSGPLSMSLYSSAPRIEYHMPHPLAAPAAPRAPGLPGERLAEPSVHNALTNSWETFFSVDSGAFSSHEKLKIMCFCERC